MLDHDEEALMRHRTRVKIAPLFLLLLIGALALPMIPSASAEADRTDWAARIVEMDEALKRGDAPAAHAAWREAYVAAHVGRGWPGMVAVGEAALWVGRVTGTPDVYEPRARRAYLTALLRARRHGSLEGVLAAGDAFGRLGDQAVVQQALAVATDLAARSGDDTARRRVQSFRSQWAPRGPLTARHAAPGPSV
jgi:hypothetical protein